MDLSIIVPVYNEGEGVEALAKEIISALRPTEKNHELIIVDDGSTDGSFQILSDLNRQDPRIKVLRLKRNFGQTAALAAGMAHATGEVIVFLDGDGQNDPKDIPALLAKMEEGFDLVNGWRSPRRDPFWSRRLPSLIANKVISFNKCKHQILKQQAVTQ